MADYRLTKCQNGWLVIEDAGLPYTEAVAANKLRTWIAHTAAEAGEIIGREEGELPAISLDDLRAAEQQGAAATAGYMMRRRAELDNQEQEEGRD